MAPLSLHAQPKPEPAFSDDEEAFFRAGDQLADAPVSSDRDF